MDVLRNNEEKVMCPYNAAHYIMKYRMEVHLTKCRKTYNESGNARLVICDFNATHRVPEPEKQYHHENCPSRKEVELQVYAEAGLVNPVANQAPLPGHIDTSWDDGDVPSYNPQEACLNRDVLRRLDVESAAKKRDFRQSERHRMNNLEPVEARTARPGAGRSQSTTSLPVGTKNSSNQAPKSGSTPNLPPTPSFSSASIEATPGDVVERMNQLLLQKPRAVIPKKK